MKVTERDEVLEIIIKDSPNFKKFIEKYKEVHDILVGLINKHMITDNTINLQSNYSDWYIPRQFSGTDWRSEYIAIINCGLCVGGP